VPGRDAHLHGAPLREPSSETPSQVRPFDRESGRPPPHERRGYFFRAYFAVKVALPRALAFVMYPMSAGEASAGTSSLSALSA
jgi:hypothetical protein